MGFIWIVPTQTLRGVAFGHPFCLFVCLFGDTSHGRGIPRNVLLAFWEEVVLSPDEQTLNIICNSTISQGCSFPTTRDDFVYLKGVPPFWEENQQDMRRSISYFESDSPHSLRRVLQADTPTTLGVLSVPFKTAWASLPLLEHGEPNNWWVPAAAVVCGID